MNYNHLWLFTISTFFILSNYLSHTARAEAAPLTQGSVTTVAASSKEYSTKPLPQLPRQQKTAELPTCEIQNKHQDSLWVTLFNGDASVTGGLVYEIKGQPKNDTPFFFEKPIDTAKTTYLAVWTQKPPTVPWMINQPSRTEKYVLFSKPPLKLYSFKPGKTCYLTWDQQNTLRPQTGKLNGLSGKTEGGYSLNKNVNSQEIYEVTYNPQTGLLLNSQGE